MSKTKYILVAAVSVALAFVFSCSDGFNGDAGKNGLDGANGANGTNCVIEVTSGADIAKGNFKIVCGNTVVGYLNNGVNGTPGANGAPGVGGSDGANGANCAVEAMESGNYKVICGNTVMGYLNSGVNGLPGIDGTDGIDGADGEDGAKGELGPDGNDGADGKKGTSCVMVDIGTHVEIRCGNNPAVNMSKVEWCDAVPYNPAVKFCSEGLLVYDLCGGSSYDPIKYFCHDSKLYSCGNLPHNPLTHSCYDEVLYSCNNLPYNPETQFCSSDAIYSKCGGEDYNPSMQFCSSSTIYDKCGGDSYNPSTQFCSDDVIYSKCGGKDYNPLTQFCSSDAIYSKCGGEDYNPTTHFCDIREGKLYKYVLIGTQTWMAENLNYDVSGSKCYGNDDANCLKYGHLYNWSTVMGLSSSCNTSTCSSQIQSPHRGICPEGWHIPSNADWDKLYRYADGTTGTSSPYNSPTAGKYLKATSGWNSSGNGTDNYGFSALPGGYGTSGGSFFNVGLNGLWWSASEYDASYAYIRIMYYDFEGANWGGNGNYKTLLFAVRCLED